MNPNTVLFVIAIICLITFVITRRIFQEQFKIGPPTLLAAAVAGLAFIGLTSHGDGMVGVVLLPYAALALALLLLLLLYWLGAPFNDYSDHSPRHGSSDQFTIPPKSKPKRISPKPSPLKSKPDQSVPPRTSGAAKDAQGGIIRQPPRWQGRRYPYGSDRQ